VKPTAIARSAAAWNRSSADLDSDEFLAQLLDRGEIEAWRELYALARQDVGLRRRILRIVHTVPLPLPRLWLAALGESVDLHAELPSYDQGV
jgi:hypothetical protein